MGLFNFVSKGGAEDSAPPKDGKYSHKGNNHPWKIVNVKAWWPRNNGYSSEYSERNPKGNRFELVCMECGEDTVIDTNVYMKDQILEEYITNRGWSR